MSMMLMFWLTWDVLVLWIIVLFLEIFESFRNVKFLLEMDVF